MRTLTLLLATTALALVPIAAEAGTFRTIGLSTSQPVLTTGLNAKPMIQYSTPLIKPAPLPTDPGTPPIVGEGGYDPGTGPEPTDDPYIPTPPSGDDGEANDDPFRP